MNSFRVSLRDPRLLRQLRCPLCGHALTYEPADGAAAPRPLRGYRTPAIVTSHPAQLRCEGGHAFDIARQGHVSFLVGARGAAIGDSAPMVMAREGFLAAGHFAPVEQALTDRAREAIDLPGLVVDVGGGTGHYLARVLEALPRQVGACVDASAYALRRAARAHPRAVAIGADVWRTLPFADGAASVMLCLFAPRHDKEFARVLSPAGRLLVVTPGPGHLGELIEPLGMVRVDPDKERRVAESLGSFALLDERGLEFTMLLDHAAIADVVAMGPSARHLEPSLLAERIAQLPSPLRVSGEVRLAAYRRAG